MSRLIETMASIWSRSRLVTAPISLALRMAEADTTTSIVPPSRLALRRLVSPTVRNTFSYFSPL